MSDVVDQARHDVLCRQVANLVVTGLPQSKIIAELGITKYQLKSLLGDANTQKYIADAGDEITRQGLMQIRKAVGQMTGLALKALEEHLRKKSLEAVKLHFKVAGALQENENRVQGDTQINVVIPGQSQPQPITVEARPVSDDGEDE